MKTPRFTFCIPNLNKISFLPACITSLLNQTSKEWQCIFVDGFSDDGSWEYIQQFQSDPRFHIKRGIQQGMYADWNECLKFVETEYFYFLPSDDICFPELVHQTVAALDSYLDVDVCHFKFAYINEYGKTIASYDEIIKNQMFLYYESSKFAHRRSAMAEFMMHFVYRTIYRTINSLVFRRSLISKMNGFASCYGSAGDYDWTMRMGLYTDTLYIPELLAAWRKYDGQATQSPKSSQNNAIILQIARQNLDKLSSCKKPNCLKEYPAAKNTLAYLRYEYALSLSKQLKLRLNLFETLAKLVLLFSEYPVFSCLIFLRKVFRYPSYPCFSKDAFALEILRMYDLYWPPVHINFRADCFSSSTNTLDID